MSQSSAMKDSKQSNNEISHSGGNVGDIMRELKYIY